MDVLSLGVLNSFKKDVKTSSHLVEQRKRSPNYAYWGNIGGRCNSSSHAANCYSSTAFQKAEDSFTTATYWEASDATYPQWLERSLTRTVRANRIRIFWEPGPSIPIIGTHDVYADASGINTTTVNFSSIMDYLSTNNYQPIFWSEAVTFVKTGLLPTGVIKPCLIFFLGGGYGGVYDNAFPILQTKTFKFNIAVATSLIDNSLYISSAEYHTMLATGLLEMHLYDPIPHNVQIGPDGTEDRDFAFREYYPATQNYEKGIDYERRMYDRYYNAINILRNNYGQTQELITEVPSWAYSKQGLRVLERVGLSGAYNLGMEYTLFGRQMFMIQDSHCTITEGTGTLETRTGKIASATFAAPTKIYQYEVYVSDKNYPTTAEGWESSTDWKKVVAQRDGAGITIDPIYPLTSMLNDHRADCYPINTFIIKVIGETGNNAARIYSVELYYEGNEDVDVDSVRIENVEKFNHVVSNTHAICISGKSLMPLGETSHTFNFPTNSYAGVEATISEIPNVIVTPYVESATSPWTGKSYWIKATTTTSFTLALDSALANNAYFFWIAMANKIFTVDE